MFHSNLVVQILRLWNTKDHCLSVLFVTSLQSNWSSNSIFIVRELPKMCVPFQFGGLNMQSSNTFFISRSSLDMGNLNFREASNHSSASALQDEVRPFLKRLRSVSHSLLLLSVSNINIFSIYLLFIFNHSQPSRLI